MSFLIGTPGQAAAAASLASAFARSVVATPVNVMVPRVSSSLKSVIAEVALKTPPSRAGSGTPAPGVTVK